MVLPLFLPFCSFAHISHNILPSNFALALAMSRGKAMIKLEGKTLYEIWAKGQNGKIAKGQKRENEGNKANGLCNNANHFGNLNI